ncbi:hypothetical protein, partial [Nitrosomonas ureae]
ISSSLNLKLWRCMKLITFLSVEPESMHLPDEPYLRTKKTIGWDKTDHVYPDDNALNVFKPKLGEFLIASRILTKEQIDNALSRQLEQPCLLGDILCELGYIQRTHLEEIIENM